MVLPLYLLPYDFGVYALAAFFSGLLAITADLGLSTDLIRRKERFPEAAETAFAIQLLIAFGLIAFSVLVGWIASSVYGTAVLQWPILILTTGLVFQAISMVPRVLATRKLDFKRAAIPDSSGKISGVFLSMTLAVLGLAYWSPILGAVVGLAIGAILQLGLTTWSPRLRFHKGLAREMVRFGQFVTLAVLANFVAHSIDNVIVGALLGVAPLGYYAVAYSWGVYFTSNLTSVLSPVAYPVIAQFSKQPERLRRAVSENLRYYAYVATCLTVGVAVLAPTFISVIYGPAWSAAVVPMQLLAPVGLLLGYGAILGDALYAIGQSRRVFLVTWAEVGLLLLLLPPATAIGSLAGTSLAALAGAALVALAMTRELRKAMPTTRIDWAGLMPPGVAGVGAAAAAVVWVLVMPATFPAFVLSVAVVASTYVVLLQVLSRGRFFREIRDVIRLALGRPPAA